MTNPDKIPDSIRKECPLPAGWIWVDGNARFYPGLAPSDYEESGRWFGWWKKRRGEVQFQQASTFRDEKIPTAEDAYRYIYAQFLFGRES